LRLAVPEFWMVMVCVLVDPTATLPKATGVGTIEICGSMPVPERVIVAGELVALLSRVRLPADAPVREGVKATPTEAFCPGVRVRGVARGVAVNPFPEVAS